MVGTVDVVVVVGHGQRGTADGTCSAVEEATTCCGNTNIPSTPAQLVWLDYLLRVHVRSRVWEQILHQC